MAKVEIQIVQAGKGPFAAGKAARDLDLYSVGSNAVYFSNSSSTGITKYEWVLESQPPDSIVTLLSADQPTCELRPDKFGRYVVSLRINDLGNDTPGYGKTTAGCSFDSLGTLGSGDELGDFDPPAFNEETYANWEDFYGPDNNEGAQHAIYRFMYQMRTYVMPMVVGVAGTVRQQLRFMLSRALIQRSDTLNPAWVDAAYIAPFDMVDYPWIDTVHFAGLFFREGTTGSAQVRLYDVTNAVAVTNSTVSTTSTSPVVKTSIALTVGSAPGNMRNDAPTLYKVQINMLNGVPATDFCNLLDTWVELRA